MKKNIIVTALLVGVVQVIVVAFSLLNLYINDELHRMAYDLSFGAFLVFLIAPPIFMYFLNQRDRLRNMNEELALAHNEAKRADRAKSEFLANMSHEIRTPMNGVMGMAELLAATELDANQKMFTDVINKSGAALLTIINDVLDFSKIESGSLELDPAPFEVKNAVEDVAALLSSNFSNKNIELNVNIDPDLPQMLVGDVGRIRQILTNMLGNAAKFTDSGRVEVNLSGEHNNRNDSIKLRVSVKDTGIGISADDCKRIFEKFSQADNSATRNHEGTGLGLSISMSLVKLMNGTLQVESEPGKGSTFWFEVELPVHQSRDEDFLSPAAITADANLSSLSPVRAAETIDVLIAEDNEVNQIVFAQILNFAGWSYKIASDGNEALKYHKRYQPALILMDVSMPNLNGHDATRKIRSHEEATGEHTPIIAVTAHAIVGDREKCIEAGMDDYICKPISPDQLEVKIRNWLERSGQPAINAG